jgi:hypothetical protein
VNRVLATGDDGYYRPGPVSRSSPRPRPSGLARKFLATGVVGLALPHCFHRFADQQPAITNVRDDGEAGGDGGESGGGNLGGASMGGSSGGDGAGGAGGGASSGASGAGATGDAGNSGARGGSGGTSGSAGRTGSAGAAATDPAGGSGGDLATGGESATGGDGGQPAEKPQCAIGFSAPRVVVEEDFESYALGAPYGQNGSSWVRAVEGRVGAISSERAASGTHSFELASFTTASEVAYVSLALAGPPRRVVVELRYAPEGSTVFKDFAELGLARVPSKFDLRPAVAFEVNDHVLELRASPEKPIASSNGQGAYEPATKPPFVSLFDEVDYANDGSTISYLRFDLDYCSDTVSAYVGTDDQAPLVGTGSFDGATVPEAVYVAGGLSTTFVDDVRVLVDD